MVSCVDFGFGVHPLHHATGSTPNQTSEALAELIAKMGDDGAANTNNNRTGVISPGGIEK